MYSGPLSSFLPLFPFFFSPGFYRVFIPLTFTITLSLRRTFNREFRPGFLHLTDSNHSYHFRQRLLTALTWKVPDNITMSSYVKYRMWRLAEECCHSWKTRLNSFNFALFYRHAGIAFKTLAMLKNPLAVYIYKLTVIYAFVNS